jgi:hypothetical protein
MFWIRLPEASACRKAIAKVPPQAFQASVESADRIGFQV